MTKKIQKISLAEDLVTDVCLGRHKNTVRIGDKYAELEEGPAVFISAETATKIPVMITKITEKPFARIGKRDAEEQGATVEALKDSLKNIHYRHAHVTGRTPTYIVHIAPPDTAEDLKAILGVVKRQMDELSAEFESDQVLFEPDFQKNGTRGNNENLGFYTHDSQTVRRLHSIFRQAVAMDTLAVLKDKDSDKKDVHILTVTGNMADVREKLEKTYPEPEGVIKGPTPL